MKRLMMIAVLLSVCRLAQADDDPQIEDKPLSQCAKQLRSENRGLQIRAARALAEAPTNLYATIMPSVLPVLKSERENDKFVAAQILGVYGPIARVAVPDLLPMLKGTQYERNRAAAAKALGQILKDAKPDDEVEKVTKELVVAFNDPYSDVRREALTACGMIGPAAKSCIAGLAPKLTENGVSGGAWGKDECYLVREAAAYCVKRMGPLAKEHVDLMISKLHQEGQKSPMWGQALGAIGPVQDNIVPNIVDKLEVPDPSMWWQIEAYDVLASFGPKAAPAADLVCRYVREWKFDAKGMTRLVAVLKAVGPGAKNAEKTLQGLLAQKYHYRPGSYDLENANDWAAMKQMTVEALEAITGQKVEYKPEPQKRP